MNLIEQLGGYEKALQFFKIKNRKLGIDPVFQLDGQEIIIDALDDALLQYRRENNIFEAGDRVFYTGRANDNDLYTIKETYSDHGFVVGSNGADKDFWTLFIEEIRHATNAEIKANKREVG